MSKTKRTAYIEDLLFERASEMLGTNSTTEILNEGLSRMVKRRPHPLGRSGKPPVARRVDDALAEAGFGVE